MESVSIEDKRKLIKKTGRYVNHWSDDSWLVKNEEYADPDKATVSTENLYNALTYEEPDRIDYMKDGKVVHSRIINKILN
jgi:hypothetical protein